jgi:hypothetical protein
MRRRRNQQVSYENQVVFSLTTKGGFSSFIFLAGGCSFRLKKLAVQGMAPAVQTMGLHHATC